MILSCDKNFLKMKFGATLHSSTKISVECIVLNLFSAAAVFLYFTEEFSRCFLNSKLHDAYLYERQSLKKSMITVFHFKWNICHGSKLEELFQDIMSFH